jgi:hypothetical protein
MVVGTRIGEIYPCVPGYLLGDDKVVWGAS